MSTRRRTLVRTVAVSVTVGGALLLPAASALADSDPGTDTGSTTAATAAADIDPGGDPALLAAGGGMAAAGAAGLGFAMLRRGRTDG